MKHILLSALVLNIFACSDSTTTFDIEYAVESSAPFTVTYQAANHSIKTVQVSATSWAINAAITVDNSTPNPTIIFEVKPTAQSDISLIVDGVSLVSEQINHSIVQISDIIEKSAEDIHATTAAGEKLALHGKRLRELVVQFKY